MKEEIQQTESLLNLYLDKNPLMSSTSRSKLELEFRFGSDTYPIQKHQYERVIQTLYSHGFSLKNGEQQMLRMYSRFTDKEGKDTTRGTRTEIEGMAAIQLYCESNSISSLLEKPNLAPTVIFTDKKNVEHAEVVRLSPFHMRASLKEEIEYKSVTQFPHHVSELIQKWKEAKKMFRLMNRVQFEHDEWPFFVDLTCIKTNANRGGANTESYVQTFQDARLINAVEHFEIEIEVDNTRVGTGTPYHSFQTLWAKLQSGFRLIHSGLQNTPFPIPYPEQERIRREYSVCLYKKIELIPRHGIEFCGPSSVTLQWQNLVENHDTKTTAVSIRKGYSVTDKADGVRHLLWIAQNQRVYMFNKQLDVIFAGVVYGNKEEWDLSGTLLDGEFISHDKDGSRFINLFAVFDIYFLCGESIRELPFMTGMPKKKDSKYASRHEALQDVVAKLHLQSVLAGATAAATCPPFRVEAKHFEAVVNNDKAAGNGNADADDHDDNDNDTIFTACRRVLERIVEYKTDGLIFTPLEPGVGAAKRDEAGPYRTTWPLSFKWKPPQFNTIDFLVKFQRNSEGKENWLTSAVDGQQQERVLILGCGFDRKRDVKTNPFQAMLDDHLPVVGSSSRDSSSPTYVPAEFVPSNPYDPEAKYCHVAMDMNHNSRTENNEVIGDNTIVEFRYDASRPARRRWIPLRVRDDKTRDFTMGKREYGNAYHVANDNWRSIHQPVTESLLSGGEEFNEANFRAAEEDDGDNARQQQYYQPVNQYGQQVDRSWTQAMRRFHNTHVKRALIQQFTSPGQLLLDLAVGKAGDLNKWMDLKFVLGVDKFRDNIYNPADGACVRYLQRRAERTTPFRAIFIPGDSSLNLRKGEGLSDREKRIAQALFGVGGRDVSELGKVVHDHYGIAQHGFHTVSLQFAMHYFWKDWEQLHGLLRNVAENTRMDGYFIGTCYDGKQVFEKLRGLTRGESWRVSRNNHDLLEIKKEFDATTFQDDDTCLGMAIDVSQETITQREYLVNFDYLVSLMQLYGFVPLSPEDLGTHTVFSAGGSLGTFESLAEAIEKKENKYTPSFPVLSAEEKQISYLNRYFIFKKIKDELHPERIPEMIQRNARERAESRRLARLSDVAADESDPWQVPAADVANAVVKPGLQVLRLKRKRVVIG